MSVAVVTVDVAVLRKWVIVLVVSLRLGTMMRLLIGRLHHWLLGRQVRESALLALTLVLSPLLRSLVALVARYASRSLFLVAFRHLCDPIRVRGADRPARGGHGGRGVLRDGDGGRRCWGTIPKSIRDLR